MPQCISLLLTRPWNCVVSSLYIRFRNKVDLLTSSLFLSTRSTNHWIVSTVLLTTLCLMLVPLLLRCFWVENRIRMVKGEHIPIGSNTAETKDRTILWVVFAGISCSVPRQTKRLSVSTFQFSPRIDDNCDSASKVFHKVDMSASGICDLNSSSLAIHFVNESTFTKDLSDFLIDFNCFLECFDWLEEVLHVEIPPNRFDKFFVVFRVIFRHLMQSVICTSRQTLRPKSVWCILVNFYPLVWIFSPEKS